jgi:fructuronate reductase
MIMKLSDIKNGNLSAEWAEKGYELPKFDIEAVKAKTHAEPTWVHFGAGNIFRAFPAAVLNDALNSGKYDRGVIVAESFDYEIIDKAYQPYDNLSLLVCLKSTGEIEKKVIASVTESLKADYSFGADWARLVEIFQNPSLQMISFTITEKGYGVAPADLERGLTPVLAMGKVTALLYERFKAGKLPLTVQSMDNCSHNGDKVKTAVHAYAAKWVEQGLVPAEFLAYVQDETKVTFPWSMIDKITPRPDAKVQEMLAKDGFEDNYTIVTEKHTFTAPFVNAEETQYLCIEDHYTNGRPPLELGVGLGLDGLNVEFGQLVALFCPLGGQIAVFDIRQLHNHQPFFSSSRRLQTRSTLTALIWMLSSPSMCTTISRSVCPPATSISRTTSSASATCPSSALRSSATTSCPSSTGPAPTCSTR